MAAVKQRLHLSNKTPTRWRQGEEKDARDFEFVRALHDVRPFMDYQ